MRSHLETRIAVSSTAPASPAEAFENAPDLASPCCASNGNSCFKENINKNISETPKLSLEPLQMKRKKRGGEYNLRKSLAWDRAFFTEEGILDPLELSTISDVSCREELSFIHEETHGGSQQDEDLGKHRKKDCSSMKLDSSSSNFMTSSSLTSHKFPTHLGNKNWSRYSDCPRPLPSPSLKRPANVNVGKAAGKELKLPKVPGLKPGLSPTCATARNTILRANRVKHNQITQPDFGTLRNAVLKSSSKSLKNTQNAPSTNTLQLAHHPQENSGNSAFRRLSSINMSPLMADKADNSGSKMISDNATPAKPYNSFEGRQYDLTTFATPFSQNAHISGRTVHPLQNQTMKPSGLRMPSPSLSFFSQPKPLVSRDLPLRATETDVFGSQKTGNLRLQDKLRGTPKTYSRIPDSTISSHKAVSFRSECMVPPQVSAMELIKPNSEKNPMHKIQDLRKKNIIESISQEEAELQKISIEVPAQSGFREQATDRIFKAIHGNSEKSESCESEWRNAELGSVQNHAIQKFETISAIDEPPKEKNACNFLVLNQGSTQQCTDALDDRVQSTLKQRDWGKTCKPDCHEPHRDKIEPIKYSLTDTDMRTDEDKNLFMIKERISEQLGEKRSCEKLGEERAIEQLGEERAGMQLGLFQQNGSCCSGSTKALEQRQTNTQNPYFGSKDLCVDPLKESASFLLADNLSSGEALMYNSVCDSAIGSCNNDINILPEEGGDTKQPQKGSEVQVNLKVEMGLEKIVNSNSSGRLSSEKQRLLQNSQQEENVEKLMFAALDRKDGDEMIDTRVPLCPSLDRWNDINLCRQNTAQPLLSRECEFTDNSLSSESHNRVINMIHNSNDEREGHDTVLLNAATIEKLSNCLHQDTQRMSDDCNSLSESRILQLPKKYTLEKMTEESPCIQDDYANNRLISTMSVEDNESDIDNLRGLWNTGTMLVQAPESNILDNCSLEQSKCLTLARDEFIAENLVHCDHTLQSKSYEADMYCEDNALGGMEDSVTGQSEICLSILKSSRLSEKESSLKRETCNDAYEAGDCFVDATSPSRVEPMSDGIKDEVSECSNSSFICVHSKPDHVKVEVAVDPINKHGNCLNEKSRSLVLPKNAVPFSDEWLAAIEAAGEDILTKKSGAVQNSPPDKSVPEPSPWSPVKRKNNQIGPFDCTKKFSAPSDSN